MSFTYDITTSKKDNRSTICLSVCHVLNTIISLFLSTFLVAHIYTLSSDLFSYAINVGIYHFFAYLTMFVSYYLFSFWVDKSNRLWGYRIGNIISAVLVVVTIFYGKDLAKIIALAGMCYGLSHGAYYASYNVLKQEMVSRKSIKSFAIILTVLGKVVNVVCPILLGMLIEISTYSMVAVYVLFLSLILIVLTFFIRAKRPENSGFSIKNYFNRLKENPALQKKVKSIYIMCIFYAFTTVAGSLLSINIMMQFGSSFSLGTITSVFALISVVVLLLFNKFTKSNKRSWIYVLCMILPVLGAVIFSIKPGVTTLIIYNLFICISEVIVSTVFDVIRNKNLKEAGFYQDIAEHQCVVESIFQIVRIVTYALLILISLLKNLFIFQILFVVFVIAYSVINVLLMKYEKEENEVDNQEIDKT